MMQRARLHGCLALAQLAFAGFEILSRIALTNGTHPVSFTFYRNCVASLVMVPVAAWTERRHKRPEIGTLFYFFVLGFLGVTVNQVCYLAGLKYTSAIFASAMRNSTPAFTFVIAALWRLEKVDVKKRHGQLKVFGSLLGLCGSLILSIYKGPVVINSNISVSTSAGAARLQVHPDDIKTLHLFGLAISMASWQIGAIFLTLSCITFGGFLILQTPVLENYPAPISFAALACLSSVVQTPLLEVAYERNQWKRWKLTSASEALAIVYAGVIGSALVSSIQSWGVLTQGPVIVAAYQPLETIFTALFSMVFLQEDLHLGSIVGGTIVVAGLYSLIWGQQREQMLEGNESTTPGQVPEAFTSAGILSHSPFKFPFRRFSCDIDTRRRENLGDERPAQRRHSLTVIANNSDYVVVQGPLRRMSSTFRHLLAGVPVDRGADIENQQLLPQ